jgi:hypothetical protein
MANSIVDIQAAITRVVNQSNQSMGSLQFFDNQLANAENRVDDLMAEVRTVEGRLDSLGADMHDLDDTDGDLRDSINRLEGEVVTQGEDFHAKLEMANDRIQELETQVGLLQHCDGVQDRRMHDLELAVQRMQLRDAPPVPRAQPNPNSQGMMAFMLGKVIHLEETMGGFKDMILKLDIKEVAEEGRRAIAAGTDAFSSVINGAVREHRDWMEAMEVDVDTSHTRLSGRVTELFDTTRIHALRLGHLEELVHGGPAIPPPAPAAVAAISNTGPMPEANANIFNLLPPAPTTLEESVANNLRANMVAYDAAHEDYGINVNDYFESLRVYDPGYEAAVATFGVWSVEANALIRLTPEGEARYAMPATIPTATPGAITVPGLFGTTATYPPGTVIAPGQAGNIFGTVPRIITDVATSGGIFGAGPFGAHRPPPALPPPPAVTIPVARDAWNSYMLNPDVVVTSLTIPGDEDFGGNEPVPSSEDEGF